ncbi:MAG: ACT domain-containing protein [bacterium]
MLKVIKIGGSVFRKENLIELAEFIVKNYEPYKTVIVVSALGRSPYPYSTDELINLFKDFNNGKEVKDNYLIDLSKSFVISCGENIATGLLAFAINNINPNFKAVPLNAFQSGIITTNNPINADIIDVQKERILELINAGYTPVICGFQGVSQEGNLTILRRGGTDITAAYIAKRLQAQEIHIIKDVDGLKSAPPNIVKNAITIDKCHIDELAEASHNGNPVVNPEGVNILQKSNIPIIIKSPFGGNYTFVSSQPNKNLIITNISNKDNVIKFVIFLPAHIKQKTQILDKCLQEIYQNSISLDFINLDILNNIASFIVENADKDKVEKILQINKVKYRTIKRLSKISVIGYNMRGKPGVMYRVNKALLNQKIFILQAQDSHISLSLLVPTKFTIQTVQSLHNEFFEKEN